MVEITEKGLLELHKIVESKFPDSVLKGVKYAGMVKAIIERPSTKLFEKHEPYNTIFTKAASLMEAIIRWHIFNDGNKRTGLLAAFVYLQANDHYLAIPLDAVRFTVEIAENTNQEPEATASLVQEIANWLEMRTGKNSIEFSAKALKFVIFPIFKFLLLNTFGFKKRVAQQVIYWFAIDKNKEYAKELDRISSFLFETLIDTSKAILMRTKSKRLRKKIFKFLASKTTSTENLQRENQP
jgi:death-on-curing protein